MSYKRFENSDVINSIETITSPIWSDNQADLFANSGNIILNPEQSTSNSGLFYLQVHKNNPSNPIEFNISYGNKAGNGSNFYYEGASGTYSQTIYGQYKNLILGNLYESFNFNDINDHFLAINIERLNYKEKLLLGSLSLTLSSDGGLNIITLTDDSKYTTAVSYTEAGRKFNLIEGSFGTASDPENISPSYGWLLPDIGVILINPDMISNYISEPIDTNTSSSFGIIPENGDISSNKLLASISNGKGFYLRSEETLSSIYTFVRARNNEFNYTENPSFVNEDGDIIWSDFIYNPRTYITTVGFYNDKNELLAVAKLSRPLPKDFTKELLIRSKLSY